MQLTHRLAETLAETHGHSLILHESSLVALFFEFRDNAERSGGRGISGCFKDILIEDLLDLQNKGTKAPASSLKEDASVPYPTEAIRLFMRNTGIPLALTFTRVKFNFMNGHHIASLRKYQNLTFLTH